MTAMPYFVADSASVTVLRSLASTAFGKYNLTLPDGVDLEDVYEVSADGNELAYVASLGARRRVGGMFRRFVRADVNVTAQGEDVVPTSDVERVLDDAEKRVSGDFFLESDITRAGLGPWVPFVDFIVGDIVNVEIWGRVVPLAVTRIEPKRTEHSDNDWSVHVGGQLLSDAEARLAENADIYNAVVSDRRDLAGLDGKIRAETNNRKAAVSAEREARTAGDEALSKRIDALPSSESLNADIMEINERIKALGGESAAARDALMERLRGELAEASGAAASARRGLQRELEGKITALGGAQDEARRRDMEALNGRISGLNSDLTLLKQTEINDLQSKWNAQQGEINKQNEQYRKLQSEWNRQQGEINQQNAKYQALDAEWKKQQQEINRQGSEFREMQTVINDKQTGINALNTMFQQEQRKVNALNDTFRAETAERQRQDEILNAGQELALKHAQRAIDNEEKNRMRFATLSGNQVDNWIIPDVSNGCFEMRRFRKGLIEVKYSAIYVRPIKPCQGDIIVFSVNSDGGVGMAALKVTPSTPVKTELEVTGVFNKEVVQVLVMTNVNPV